MTICLALAKENIYISSDQLVVSKHTNFICKKMAWQSSLGLLSLLMRAITVVMFFVSNELSSKLPYKAAEEG